MILTDREIRALCTKPDAPLISPFQEDQLQSASYDVTMGDHVFSFRKNVQTIQLTDQCAIDALYQTTVLTGKPYVLASQEYILVSLRERPQIPQTLIAHIRPRTRFTRLGLIVSAQHCNPTYDGTLQLGLLNAGPNAVALLPGLKIAQVVFEELKGEPSPEKLYKNQPHAAYQGESEFRGAKFGGAEFTGAAKALYEEMTRLLRQEEG